MRKVIVLALLFSKPVSAMEIDSDQTVNAVARAHIELGKLAMRGPATPENLSNARDYFQKAALQNDNKVAKGWALILLSKLCRDENIVDGDNQSEKYACEAKQLKEFIKHDEELYYLIAISNNELPLNKRFEDGSTLLHYAVSKGFFELAELLLFLGCDVHLRDRQERNALELSLESDESELGKLLLTRGARLDPSEMFNENPLNRSRAIDVEKKARAQFARKMFDLGRACLKGKVYEKNSQAALFCFQCACEIKHDSKLTAHAFMQVGLCYYFDVDRTIDAWRRMCDALDQANLYSSLPVDAQKIRIISDLLRATFYEPLSELHIACITGDIELIIELLNEGQNLDQRDKEGKSALLKLILFAQKSCLDSLQKEGYLTGEILENIMGIQSIQNSSFFEESEFSLLKKAAYSLNRRVFEMLVLEGCSLDSCDSDGNTVLHSAVRDGNYAVAKFLMLYRSTLLTYNRYGSSPLLSAVWRGDIAVVDLLLKNRVDPNGRPDAPSPLTTALSKRDRSVVERLLAYNVDVNAGLHNGLPPLHLAVQQEDAYCVRLLLKKGTDVNKRSYYGPMPLHLAVLRKNKEIAALLLEAGADVKTHYSESVSTKIALSKANSLFLAALSNDVEFVKWIVKYYPLWKLTEDDWLVLIQITAGEDFQHLLQKERKYQWSREGDLLMAALAEFTETPGFSKLVLVLITLFGGAPHSYGEKGVSALHLCAQQASVPIAQALLEVGANVNCSAKNGKTPLHYAVKRQDIGMARLLLGNGANILVQDKKGNSPLSSAQQSQNPALIALLEG